MLREDGLTIQLWVEHRNVFGEYFQTVLAKSGSGYKPVLHSIAATNTI